MDCRWIRPVIRPVFPSEVGELSPAAVQVLQALQRKFQYKTPNSLYQLAANAGARTFSRSDPLSFRFMGGAQSETSLAFSQLAHENAFDAPTLSRANAPQDVLFLPARQEPFSSMSLHNGTLFSGDTRRPLYDDFPPLSPIAPSTSTSHHERDFHKITPKATVIQDMDLSFEEISEITVGNDTTGSRKSLITSSVVNRPSRTNSAVTINSSSPISTQSVDVDEVVDDVHIASSKYYKPANEFNRTLQIASSNVHAMSKLAHSGLCISTSYDPINLSDELMTLVDMNKSFAADNQDDGSISIKPNDVHSPELQDCDFAEHVQENLSDKCTVLDKVSPKSSLDVEKISSQECPQEVLTPTLPSSSYASDTMFSDFSFDDSSNKTSNERYHSLLENDYLHKDLPQSPQEAVLCDYSNTPDNAKKKKKFLGTPFKRALSSNNISNKREQSGENSPLATLQLESRKNENREPLKSRDDNIMSSLVIEREEYSPCTATSSELQKSAHILNRPSTTCEKTPDGESNPVYFPIFTANSQVKRKNVTIMEAQGEHALPCKKKLKFCVPYKKTDQNKGPSTPQKIQELAAKLSKEAVKKEEIQKLTEKLANEILDQIRLTPPQETCLTLQYRGGFSQLNRPQKSKTHIPESIVLRIVWSSAVQFLSVQLQTKPWSSVFLRRLLSDKSRKICFDAQETIKLFVQQYGFPNSEVFSQWLVLDPLIGCWLLNPDEPPRSFKDILKFFKLQEECKSLQNQLEKLSECTQLLYETLTKVGTWKLFLHVEMRITAILACMELQGVQLNVNKLQEMAILLKDRLEAKQKDAFAAAGRNFQLTSPQQLSAILYDYLKLDSKHNISIKGTDKRQSKSTSESMLLKFKDLHPLPGIILEFRGLHKLKSTYVDAYLDQMSGDRIYTTWDQTSAATGRITSIEPNLQTIPKQPLMPDLPLRMAFISRQGYSFLAADFQHIELRVFAHLSKDNALINALSQTTDVFEVLSQKWLPGANLLKVTEEDRDKTKKVVYALMYGAGPSKLVEILQINFNEATKLLKKFSNTFPKMQTFTKDTIEKCRKQGYLATEAGRRRLFPQITNSNAKLRQHCERQAVNFLIQGTAADLCKCAMVCAQRHIAALKVHTATPVAHLLLQIHDELLWEVSDSDLEEVTDVVQEAMEGATSILQCMSNFSVPLPVLMRVGKTWGSMKIVKNSVLLGSASQQA